MKPFHGHKQSQFQPRFRVSSYGVRTTSTRVFGQILPVDQIGQAQATCTLEHKDASKSKKVSWQLEKIQGL
jgi:hypothetical protein